MFNQLRDAHVDFKNGGYQLDALIQNFWLVLHDMDDKVVTFDCAASAPVVPEGTLTPVCKDKAGKTISTIGGKAPMQWLEETFVNPSTLLDIPFKSVGPRMNTMQKMARNGIMIRSYQLGNPFHEQTSGKLIVIFADGSQAT